MEAVMFPGQGSQKPGMGAPWAQTSSWAVVGTVSDVLGRDVGALLLDADASTLQATGNAQVAAFALGVVMVDAAHRSGLAWEAAAGHSLGEYTALVAADVLSVEEATRLVGARADAMQAAADASPGTMAAVLGLDTDIVEACCREAGGGVWIANDNAPGQVVVAGTHAAVDTVAAAAKQQGGKVVPLAVGGAFHTPLMKPAQQQLDLALGTVPFGNARATVVTNVDAGAHTACAEFRALLSAQLCQPVRWRQSVLRLQELGVTRVTELGPGAVLTGMVKRVAPGLQRASAATPAELDAIS